MAETTVGLTRQVRDELRQVQREKSADQRRNLTINDVVQQLISAYRQARTRR